MRWYAPFILPVSAVMLTASQASAADIARLEWGGFVVESDSSNGAQDWKAAVSDDGHSVTLTFSALEAKADGTVFDGASSVAGYFDVSQPGSEAFTQLHVDVSGYVIKSKAVATRIVLKLGTVERTIEWPSDTAVSEKFAKSFDIVAPADGRLPDPFPVAAEVSVHKDNATDSAFISVNEIRITAGHPAIAANTAP